LPVPVLALPLWEGAGNKVFDLSKEQNHGELKNGAFWSNNALDFDGLNDGVEIPASQSLDITSNRITLSAWFCFRAIGSSGSKVICKGWGGGLATYLLHAYSTQLQFRVRINGTNYNVNGTVPVINQWYHLLGTYDGAAMRIYEDGIQISSVNVAGSITTYSQPLLIGNSGKSGGGVGDDANRNLNGQVKGVSIFDTALTATQVQTLYNNPYAMFEPTRALTWAKAGSGTPQDPYFISGTVSIDGVAQTSETVTVRNDTKGEEDTCQTDDQGHFIFMLNDLPTDYEDGDTIEVTAL
jgi:hypothetical protein